VNQKTKKNIPLKQSGFSLIELMVGMTIGLIVTVVISQVFAFFDSQRQSTTGTGDAQTNGSIALYSISREMQMAGYGLMPSGDANSPLECTTVTPGAEAIASAGMTVSAGIRNLSAVTITDGAVSDLVTINYGDSTLGGIPTTITATPVGKTLEVGSNLNCKDGDFVVIARGASCAVTRLASPTGVSGNQNLNLLASETMPVQAVEGDSNISCLGNWTTSTYSVVNGSLQRNGLDQISGIVSIQAQYGVSATANDNVIAEWKDPTGTWASAAMTTALRNRIKAVRVAVIARNAKKEPTVVTKTCDTSVSPPTGLCSWVGGPAISLSTSDADWARYRYRVFETIIPLRNVIWSKETL
jgi:type IV pilus assembly protein PilW